jgi:hypothetical protein
MRKESLGNATPHVLRKMQLHWNLVVFVVLVLVFVALLNNRPTANMPAKRQQSGAAAGQGAGPGTGYCVLAMGHPPSATAIRRTSDIRHPTSGIRRMRDARMPDANSGLGAAFTFSTCHARTTELDDDGVQLFFTLRASD